jgi:DNA replication protein DnaC
MGGVGLGKTHLACSLGYQACLNDHGVYYTTAVDIINQLTAANAAYRLKQELAKYLKPRILVCDEIGYLPIDKVGADLLFQVISGRYEKSSTIFTTNKSYKKWSEIFNNDATLSSAILYRVLHHSRTITIQGKSYRMRDKIEES